MAFIDEVKLNLKAGRGGDGVERWRHEKGKDHAGAAGGNAGRGGDVYARAVQDPGILAKYRAEKDFEARRGGDGMRSSMHGKDGTDLVLDFPVGSAITNLTTSKKYYLTKEAETMLLLTGGRGGLGNEHFKASTNVRPKQTTKGKPGEEADFLVELELVADLGLVGLPNAGKSSLLNELTNADSKVGSYEFTTLEPHLGNLYGFIIADIPGLIEGASEGRGLGHKFLRHIKKTHALLHCVSCENENILDAYKTIRDELKKFGNDLDKKDEVIIITKTDTTSTKDLAGKIKALKKKNKKIYTVSILDDTSVKSLKDQLVKMLRKS